MSTLPEPGLASLTRMLERAYQQSVTDLVSREWIEDPVVAAFVEAGALTIALQSQRIEAVKTYLATCAALYAALREREELNRREEWKPLPG